MPDESDTPTALSVVQVRDDGSRQCPELLERPPRMLETGAALAMGPEGQVYVGLPSRRAIYKRQDGNTLVPWCSPSARSAARRQRPEALAGIGVSSDGEIWLSDTANHRLARLDVAKRHLVKVAGTRAGRVDGGADEARLRGPGIFVITGDDAAIVEEGSSRLRRVRRDGAVTTLAPYVIGSAPPR